MRNREAKLAELSQTFDVLVAGGGATGLGIAVDAATRGFRTLLVEAGDFAQSTSSRSTKLVHGGVRYLASGQVALVYEALRERRLMTRNAPHLVHAQAFLTPAYRWWQLPWYGTGLKLYDVLAGRSSLGPTRLLGRRAALARVAGLRTKGLRGGVLYHDGQFDDARFALALARTAEDHEAVVLNYCHLDQFTYDGTRINGALVRDVETGRTFEVRARAVLNATGIFVDELRTEDDAASAPLVRTSRGTHIVVDRDVLFRTEPQDGGDSALMVPKTADGRVIFAIPWQGKVVIGTTDLPADRPSMEPGHTEGEIAFLLQTIAPYLARQIGPEDIRGVFSGLRPLVASDAAATSKISREHSIVASGSGLISIAGGKWTTYRRMAEQAIDFAAHQGLLERRPCVSRTVRLHGAPPAGTAEPSRYRQYGTDAPTVVALEAGEAELAEPLVPGLPYTAAEAVYAARAEMARGVEDVLSRRTRALLLHAEGALRAAPAVAHLLARELDRDAAWEQAQVAAFHELATRYYMPG